MSAEVAIIKNDCVVLAADSAVTIGGKHYNSACKLFQMAEDIPVGFMTYGSEAICGVSSTTLLKLFRKNLAGKKLPRLRDYPEAFLRFIGKDIQTFFPIAKQSIKLKEDARRWTSTILRELAQILCNEDDTHFDRTKTLLSDSAKEEILFKQLSDRLQWSKTRKPCWNIPAETRTWISRQSRESIASSIVDFDNLEYFGVTSDLFENKKFKSLLVSLFVQHYLIMAGAGTLTGLVFAGYGEQELYPSVACLEIEGVANSKLKFRYDEDNCYSVDSELKSQKSMYEARIIPFAQADEMVELYTHGIPFSLEFAIGEKIDTILTDAGLPVEKAKDIGARIRDSITDISKSAYSDPIMDMLGNLPIDEMAQLAELMIKLTAFRQRITNNEESVGEPIDVAVITKADGFIWHKRKASLVQR